MSDALNGWLVIDKPLGPGSTDIVSKVKRALRDGGYGKHKVGHGGTLDPLASGVLPVAIGEATKLAGRMLDSDKIYDFTIGFGMQTDTLDLEGTVIATSDILPTRGELDAILSRFIGPIEQVPPTYSAIKVDGERAYDRARAGETFEIKTRSVTVHRLQVLDEVEEDPHPTLSRERERAHLPLLPQAGEGWDEGLLPSSPSLSPLPSITLTAHVSKGTYIRSLARDIAIALGTVGHVTMLRRSKAGPFSLEQAISLDKLAESGKARALEAILLPLTAGLDDIPAFSVTPDQAGALRQGRKLIGHAAVQGLNLAMEGQVPVALVEVDGPEVRVVRGFNL